jgi:hypothetical protein
MHELCGFAVIVIIAIIVIVTAVLAVSSCGGYF